MARFVVTGCEEGEGEEAVARAGTRVDETVPCEACGTGEALDRLLAAVSATGEYQAVQVAPDRLQFARTFRPTWAIVSGFLTIWIALLGILFFLVKSTETCLAVIESDHRGTRIRLVGRLSSATLGRIRASLSDGSASAATPAQAIGRPVPTAFDVRPLTSFPANAATSLEPASASPFVSPPPPVLPAPPPLLPASAAPATPGAIEVSMSNPDADATVIHPRGGSRRGVSSGPFALLDDGSRVELAAHNLIGRDPVADSDAEPTRLLPIDDPTRSVSKTHLAVSFRDQSWWITDLHSTNGVEIVSAEGRVERLRPGSPIAVPAGASVRFGERTLQLALGAPS